MWLALRSRWREGAIESALLALFMLSASAFTILLEHPASPVLRAGFMLIPDRGASMAMNVATSVPAKRPVYALSRSDALDQSTHVNSTLEMSASAAKAMAAPRMPGRVTT